MKCYLCDMPITLEDTQTAGRVKIGENGDLVHVDCNVESFQETMLE